MTHHRQALIIDDQIGDLMWLVDLLQHLGWVVRVAETEKAALTRLDAFAAGDESYDLVVLDVMIATHTVDELMAKPELVERALESPIDAGIRLARHIRRQSTLVNTEVVCCTVRDDDDVYAAMDAAGIQIYSRDDEDPDSDRPSLRTLLTGITERTAL